MPDVAESSGPPAGTRSHSSGYIRMPAPITARAMNPTRHSKGSVPVYSARPPQTPPSTLLVALRRRWGGETGGAVAAGGCQDGCCGWGGSPGNGRPAAAVFGVGVDVMDGRLSLPGAV